MVVIVKNSIENVKLQKNKKNNIFSRTYVRARLTTKIWIRRQRQTKLEWHVRRSTTQLIRRDTKVLSYWRIRANTQRANNPERGNGVNDRNARPGIPTPRIHTGPKFTGSGAHRPTGTTAGDPDTTDPNRANRSQDRTPIIETETKR